MGLVCIKYEEDGLERAIARHLEKKGNRLDAPKFLVHMVFGYIRKVAKPIGEFSVAYERKLNHFSSKGNLPLQEAVDRLNSYRFADHYLAFSHKSKESCKGDNGHLKISVTAGGIMFDLDNEFSFNKKYAPFVKEIKKLAIQNKMPHGFSYKKPSKDEAAKLFLSTIHILEEYKP